MVMSLSQTYSPLSFPHPFPPPVCLRLSLANCQIFFGIHEFMIWFPALAAVAVIRLNQQLEAAEKANNSALQPRCESINIPLAKLNIRYESLFQEKMEYCHRVEIFSLNQIGDMTCDNILSVAPLCLYILWISVGLIIGNVFQRKRRCFLWRMG
jgi:hypothetical protein